MMIQQDKARMALELALKAGAEGARISLSEGVQRSWSLLSGQLDRLQYAAGASLVIQLYRNGCYGSFTTNRMEREDLAAFVRHAADSVALLTPDPAYRMPDPSLLFRGEAADLGQYDAEYGAVEDDRKTALLREAWRRMDAAAARGKAPLIASELEYGDSLDEFYLIDSLGFEGCSRQTYYTLSAECTVRGERGEKPQGWWYEASMDWNGLAAESCAEEALARALRMRAPRRLRPGRYAVVLENTVSSRMVAPILSALSGAAIQQQHSFLLDSLGASRFPECVTLRDEPWRPGAMGSRWFDSEGIATRPAAVIERGVVRMWFLNTYSAAKLEMPVTVEGVSVPVFDPVGAATQAEMLQDIGAGVLVTGFNGGNCNGATGDFSYGIEGFYFEDGCIRYPIREMNLSGNVLDLWSRIRHIGTDYRQSARWLIPTLAFEGAELR